MRFNLLRMVITNVLRIKISAYAFYKYALECQRNLPEEYVKSYKTEERRLIIYWKYK